MFSLQKPVIIDVKTFKNIFKNVKKRKNVTKKLKKMCVKVE